MLVDMGADDNIDRVVGHRQRHRIGPNKLKPLFLTLFAGESKRPFVDINAQDLLDMRGKVGIDDACRCSGI